MQTNHYIDATRRTWSSNQYYEQPDLLHATLGVVTEAGELADQIKRHYFYGTELDIPNIEEEIGDTLFYLARLIDLLDLTFEDIMQKNIDKLRARYPDKFSKTKAIVRDLKKERAVLES